MTGALDWQDVPVRMKPATILCAFALLLLPIVEVDAGTKPMCFGRAATIVGTPGNDGILGTEGPDVIVGRGGVDEIQGLGGNDRICAGKGGDPGLPEWLLG